MEEKSLIEYAIEWMQNQNNKDKHYTIKDIAKKAFEKKGLKISENKDEYAQFQMDFMLCGSFFSYGEEKEGNKLWDLKYRVKHDIIDKESNDYYDTEEDNEEVKKNELNVSEEEQEEVGVDQEESSFAREIEEDEEETEEKDDIEEAMEEMEQQVVFRESVEEEDDLEEDSYDDDDDK